MSLTAAAATFITILPAELPDKTILACLILSSRYRAGYVFAGAATAFAVQVVLAVAVGGALSILPHRWVYAATAAAFAAGAVLLWRQHKSEQRKSEEPEDDEVARRGTRDAFWPVAGTAFVVVFLAEFGDLTQITTVSLAARFHDPLAVGAGAILGLWTAAALAVIVGWRLLRLVKLSWLTKIAAVIMLVLAGTSAVAAAAVLATSWGFSMAGHGKSPTSVKGCC
ncbi:MAG: TMEM165/GDT1 family protein, partial [Nocardiopsaceae bacterium]|nr:TMEM165/GDT1 family protein [Nocardiopsaceae bacterium]